MRRCLEASRILAVMSPEVVPMQEFERLRLSVRFAKNCFLMRLRLRAGLSPWKGFTTDFGHGHDHVFSNGIGDFANRPSVCSRHRFVLHSWTSGAAAGASFSSFARLPLRDGNSTRNVAPPVGWFFT